MEQLQYSGVFEAVAIRRSGYPFRQTHTNFVERYAICNPDKQYAAGKPGCLQIAADMKLNMTNVQFGKTIVFYRSEENKVLELHRSINLEKKTLIDQLTRLVQLDPSKGGSDYKDPELYFQDLSKAIRRCNQLSLKNDTIEAARKLLFDFIETRIDPQLKINLAEAKRTRNAVELHRLLAECEAQDYDTSLVKACRALYDRMNRIVAESALALEALEPRAMQICLDAGDQLGINTDVLEYFRTMLTKTSKDVFCKEQMKAAVKMGDHARAIRLTIRLKDGFLNMSEDMFKFEKYGTLNLSVTSRSHHP
jgi:hypothetical protein